MAEGIEVRKGKRGTVYRVRVWDARAGRHIRRSFTSSSEAKQWRHDAVVGVRAGTLRAASAVTVGEYGTTLIEGMESGRVLDRSGKRYKPATVRSYRRVFRTRVKPQLGQLRLGEVRRSHVQAFIDDLRATKVSRGNTETALSPSTVINALDPLRVIFREALYAELVAVDPTKGLRLPRVRGKRDRIESPERAQALIDAVPDDLQGFWATAFYAGLRRGELRALRWEDVEFGAGVIRVRRGWDDYAGEIEVKSDAGRRNVPLAGAVRRHLASHKLRTDGGEGLVFGRTASEPFIPSTVRYRSNDAWKAAGLESLTPHEARHCAVSYFIACGMNPKQISVYIGHGDVRQTWNRYGHLMPGDEQAATAQLDAFLEGKTRAKLGQNDAPSPAVHSGP